MLKTIPQRWRKSTADTSTSGRHPRTHYYWARTQQRSRASGGPIGEAYGRFLELPVVLVGLWLLGAMVLGLVISVLMVVAYYSADALMMKLLAAIVPA